jgi:hypothetical protein
MSMPKGHKIDHGYATVDSLAGGAGYREIAEKMTEMGYKMNHSTARNVFLAAMSKFATEICKLYDAPAQSENIKKIASDPRFQSGLLDTIREINETV